MLTWTHRGHSSAPEGVNIQRLITVGEAEIAGGQIKDALSVTARPQVDVAQLREAVALATQLRSILSDIGGAVQ